MKVRHSSKVWLNKKKSASTGSLCIYDGPAPWNKKIRTQFIAVSDCHNSARLHRTELDTEKDWSTKVDKMIKELQKYRETLD